LSITGNGAVSGSISAGGNITAPNFIGNIDEMIFVLTWELPMPL
jgi:hypothetical protein